MAVLELDTIGPSDMPLYKQDSSRIGDDALLKYLSEMRRPGNFKLQTVRANLKLRVELMRQESVLRNVLSSSFIPIAPFDCSRLPKKPSPPPGSARDSPQRAPSFVREVEVSFIGSLAEMYEYSTLVDCELRVHYFDVVFSSMHNN